MLARTVVRAVTAVAVLASLTACAEDSVVADGEGGGGTAAAPADGTLPVDLVVDYDPGEGGDPDGARMYRLRCDAAGRPAGDGADHPEAAAACEDLAAASTDADPFAPVPDDAVCTMQYGGPDTATVTGTYRDRPVEATFTLDDGCEIGRWQDAAVLSGIGPDAADVP
jgi:hypothetical protein